MVVEPSDPMTFTKIDRAAVDEALDGEAKSWDGRVVIVHHRVGEGEQHEEVEEPPHAEPWPTVRRCECFLHAEPNQHDGRQCYDDVNPHRGNGGSRRGCKRLARLSDIVRRDPYPCSMPSCSFACAYSVRLRKEISRATAGRCYVGVVVAFVSRRVTECRFHRVLLLLLGNDLLQGKIGVDLVCVL